jgi:hypothetical protein
MNDPAEIIDQLQRLRDFVRRLLDPEDLGHAVRGDIRRAARQALHGDERRPNSSPGEKRP